jgi:hypothetical protein
MFIALYKTFKELFIISFQFIKINAIHDLFHIFYLIYLTILFNIFLIYNLF